MISKVEGDDTKDSLPAGTYFLEFDPNWKMFAEKFPLVKWIRFRVSAGVPINADMLTADQIMSIKTNGNAKNYSSQHNCPMESSEEIAGTVSLNDKIAKAIKEGKTYLMT